MVIKNTIKSKKILLVDYSILTSEIVSKFLNENGYDIETVATGEEAVQRVLGDSQLDLILMDIELAGKMNGIDAAREIATCIDIPIVFFTANISEGIINKIREIKAYGIVLKGVDKTALLYTIETALNLHKVNTQSIMFNSIFEHFVNEIYIFDSQSFKFITVNDSARKNIGYTSEELNKMTFFDIEPELDIKKFYKNIEQLNRGEQQQVFFKTMHQRKNGSLYPVKISLQLFDYGRKKLFLALVVDITECNMVKEQLSKKESILDTIISSAQDAIVITDSREKIVLWNHAAEQIFGYSQEEILGRELHSLIGVNEFAYGDCKFDFNIFKSRCKKNIRGKTVEMKARHRDGRELNIEVSISFIEIKNELHEIGIVRDISKRKQAHEELESSRKEYLELAENAPIGIIKCDREGNITYVNQKTLEILGSPGIEKTRKINLLKFPSLIKYGLSQKLEECLKNNELGIYEMDYESKWGKRVWLRLHIKPLTNRNRVKGAQIIIDDITETKRLEEELRYLSLVDYLTNAYNRRFLIQRIEKELELIQQQTNHTFSLVLFDIDHFKSINDSFGHNVGDMVLKGITKLIKKKISKVDCLARWGGEEFVILLHGMSIDDAVVLVEEFRDSISRTRFPGVDEVTASFGVVEYCSGDTVDSLIQRADELMYEAKTAGRNCVRSTAF
ncbi:PAS domain S-box protein [Tissierellaceae bacterium HCP3S3_D8]